MSTPLADRIRPDSLDDVVGQTHLLGDGKPETIQKNIEENIQKIEDKLNEYKNDPTTKIPGATVELKDKDGIRKLEAGANEEFSYIIEIA